MAIYDNVRTISAVADVDLSAIPHRFVKYGANGKAGDAGDITAGDFVNGVNAEAVPADDVFSMIVPDGCICMVEAGAAVTLNDDVMSDASGRAITATAGLFIMGTALEAAAAAGDIISIQFLAKGLAT